MYNLISKHSKNKCSHVRWYNKSFKGSMGILETGNIDVPYLQFLQTLFESSSALGPSSCLCHYTGQIWRM